MLGSPVKNIQMIDGALNTTFSLFQATDEEFALVFADREQDIEYIEDLMKQPNLDAIEAALRRIFERPVRKQEALGIHGTLFFELERYKPWYPEKREAAVHPAAINEAQRRLFNSTQYSPPPLDETQAALRRRPRRKG